MATKPNPTPTTVETTYAAEIRALEAKETVGDLTGDDHQRLGDLRTQIEAEKAGTTENATQK